MSSSDSPVPCSTESTPARTSAETDSSANVCTATRAPAGRDPDVAVGIDEPRQHEASVGDGDRVRYWSKRDPVADQPEVAYLVVGQHHAPDVQRHQSSWRLFSLEKSSFGSLNPGGSPA